MGMWACFPRRAGYNAFLSFRVSHPEPALRPGRQWRATRTVSFALSHSFLWEQLEDVQTVDSLARALLNRYDVAEEKAREDVEAFLAALMPTGAILEG